jgi:hypothetical protein
MRQENEYGEAEDDASLACDSELHAQQLERVARVSRELAMYLNDAPHRGIDLYALYRERSLRVA